MKYYYYILLFFLVAIDCFAAVRYPYIYNLVNQKPYTYFASRGSTFFAEKNTLGSFNSLIIVDDLKSNTYKELKIGSEIISRLLINGDLYLFLYSGDSILLNNYTKDGSLAKSTSLEISRVQFREVTNLDYNSKLLLFKIDSRLYSLDLSKFTISYISDNVLSACLSGRDIYFLKYNQSGVGLFKSSSQVEDFIFHKINILDAPKMQVLNDKLLIATGIKSESNSELILMNLKNKAISHTWINANIQDIHIKRGTSDIYYISKEDNKIELIKYNYLKKKIYFSTLLSDFDNYNIFKILDGKTVCIINNHLLTLDDNGTVQSQDRLKLPIHYDRDIDFFLFDSLLVISNQNNSYIFSMQENKLWQVKNTYDEIGKFIIPIILIAIIIIVSRLYFKQKKIINLFVNDNSAGITIILNKKGKITKMNENAHQLLGIPTNYNKRKKYSYYLVDEFTKSFKSYIDKSLELKESFNQKIIFSDANSTKEWIISSIPLFKFAGVFDGIIINGTDITEELEKNRLHNWSQLAHDMQTNLTTIRLNADQIKNNSEFEAERASKILNQVNILIQRVRDIVTVGRSNDLDYQEYDSAEICREVLSEFDKTMFPNVEFMLNAVSFKVKCDKPKMIRAIRNAIENGVKSMKDNKGTIILSNSFDTRYFYFKIKDSGSGMDKEIKKKMLTPYFTTGGKTGGFGIGTMIMQHVVELHGGELQIESEPNKGTEIIFAIPNINKNKKSSKTIVRKKIT